MSFTCPALGNHLAILDVRVSSRIMHELQLPSKYGNIRVTRGKLVTIRTHSQARLIG